jgi:hypothetical protein
VHFDSRRRPDRFYKDVKDHHDLARQERIDTLLALAIAFSERAAPQPGNGARNDAEVDEMAPAETLSPLQLLEGLNRSDIDEVEQRLKLIESGSRDEQMTWVASTLGHVRARVNGSSARLDENVHPTRIAESLRGEPPAIKAVVLRHLPDELAIKVAEILEVPLADLDRASEDNSSVDPGAADPQTLSIVRRSFLSNFVTLDGLTNPTALDLLSGVELARLIRLLGVRQTAVACRGITEVEMVAAFLRRFSNEDSRVIAKQMMATEEVEPEWVQFGEQLVQAAIDRGLQGRSLLDRTGLALLVLAIDSWDSQRRLYLEQKLPVAAVEEMNSMRQLNELRPTAGMTRAIRQDVEIVAQSLHSGVDAHEKDTLDDVIE